MYWIPFRMKESLWVGINQPSPHWSYRLHCNIIKAKKRIDFVELTLKSHQNKKYSIFKAWFITNSHDTAARTNNNHEREKEVKAYFSFSCNFLLHLPSLSLFPHFFSPLLTWDSQSSRIRLAIIYSRPGRLWRADTIRWRDNGALW